MRVVTQQKFNQLNGKLTQLILHFGDEMNVEQKRYGYGPSKYCKKISSLFIEFHHDELQTLIIMVIVALGDMPYATP
jgi:hypothetical protein